MPPVTEKAVESRHRDKEAEMKIDETIRKYINDEPLSVREKAALERWRGLNAGNHALPTYIERLGEERDLRRLVEEGREERFVAAWSEVCRTGSRVGEGKKKRSLNSRLRVASAAAVLVAAAILAFFMRGVDDEAPDLRFATGNNNVMLELADGTVVELGRHDERLIDDNGRIINVRDGRVIYTDVETSDDTPVFNTIVTPRGAEYRVTLSDGTAVWLNAESSLRYPQAFAGNTRHVYLRGEAYFEVTQNDDMPFVVETAAQQITVLGTSFGICAYPEDATASATVVTGSVGVRLKESLVGIVLNPGQQATLDLATGAMSISVVTAEDVVAWKDGFFSLENMTMEQIAAKLARWYDVEFRFVGDSARGLTFKGSMQRYDDMGMLFDAFAQISPLDFRTGKDGRTVEVRIAARRPQ